MKVLSICLKLYRSSRDLGIREVSKEIGISSATLSRIENGREATADSFIKVLNWLNRNEEKVSKPDVIRN